MLIDSPIITGSLVVDGDLHLPSGTTVQRPLNPLTGSLRFNSDSGSLEIFNGLTWSTVQGGAAEEAPLPSIEYLVVAGGGGGGGRHAGGGGAGGYLSSSLASVTSGSTFTVTVGSGGAGGPDGTTTGKKQGTSGTDSTIVGASISTITAIAGGGGGGDADDSDLSGTEGLDGGSGGGASYIDTGGSGTAGQGNAGGNGQGSPYYSGGGGGGASTAGTNASSNNAGSGGAGLAFTITGTSITRAGGGGAGGWNNTNAGLGGIGGGGAGTGNAGSADAGSGTVNTGGGGGGGGGEASAGGTGGSGVAIFAYESGSLNCAGGIVGDAGNGRKYNQFNTSGTLKVGNTTTDFQINTDSLVAHYDAGNFTSRGTSTWTDLQENYNISVNGPTLTNSYYYDLDGVNDYFNTTLGSIATNFTGETWQKFDTVSRATTAEYVMQFGSLGAGTGLVAARFGNSYNGGSENNKMYIHYGSAFITSTNLLNDTNWHHFVLVANGTNAKLYVDTVEWISVTITSTTTNNVFEMGRHTDGNSLYADSKIGMARVYTKALSAAEISQNYNATKTNFV